MTRLVSMLVANIIAAIFLLAGTTDAHAASSWEPDEPPDPPPPASRLGEVHGSSAQTAIRLNRFQYEMLAQRIRNAGAGGELVAFDLSAPTSGAFQQKVGRDSLQLASFNNGTQPVIRGQDTCVMRGTWFTGYDIGGNAEGTDIASRLDYAASGVQLGTYRLLDSDTMYGVFGGYAHQNVEVFADSKTSDINSGQLGAFLRRGDVCNYWLFAGALAYDSYYIAREDGGGTAIGDFDGSQASAYIERGWSIGGQDLVLEPFVAFQYIWLRQNGFVETGAGAGNLTFSDANTNSLCSILGARFTREHNTNWGFLIPELRVQWMHEFLDDTSSVIIADAVLPGTSTGVSLGQDWIILGAGLTLDSGDGASLFANYDVQLNERTALHVVSGGAQWEW